MYSIHSVDPEIEQMIGKLVYKVIEKVDDLYVSLSNLVINWWYRKPLQPSVELAIRNELRIVDEVTDCYSDVDLDDLLYVDLEKADSNIQAI